METDSYCINEYNSEPFQKGLKKKKNQSQNKIFFRYICRNQKRGIFSIGNISINVCLISEPINVYGFSLPCPLYIKSIFMVINWK